MAHFAPTPGHIRYQNWVLDNLPAHMHELVEHADDERLFLSTKDGNYRIEVRPGTDQECDTSDPEFIADTKTEFVGDRSHEYTTTNPLRRAGDNQTELYWAYKEALCHDVANKLGREHFHTLSEENGKDLQSVSLVPGETLPTVTLEYASSSTGKTDDEKLSFYQLTQDSPAYAQSIKFYNALANDPNYSPGYQRYASAVLELDQLHRHNKVPDSMTNEALGHLYQPDFQATSARLDSTGRYLEFTADLGLDTEYNLLYDSETGYVGGYYGTNRDEDFQTDPENPYDDGFPLAFMRKHRPPMEKLFKKANREKQVIISTIQARQNPAE